MKDLCASVKAFHEAFNVPIRELPALPAEPRRALRRRLLDEEYREYRDAEFQNDIVGITDALCDMVYVIQGTCLEYGIPFEECLREVCRSNLTKIGGPVREDGKILKSESYRAPRLEPILEAAVDAFELRRTIEGAAE